LSAVNAGSIESGICIGAAGRQDEQQRAIIIRRKRGWPAAAKSTVFFIKNGV
jgi:hypothetical protein